MDTVASWKEPTVSSRLQWVAGVNTIDRLASIIWLIVSKVISKNPTEPTVKAQKHLQQQAHLQFTQLQTPVNLHLYPTLFLSTAASFFFSLCLKCHICNRTAAV